ncbi:MAG: ComEA family DNA-binding protein [Candidatus Methylomirabilales bacterium]
MRFRGFAPADAAFGGLLLLVLVSLVVFRGVGRVEEGSGFALRSGVTGQPHAEAGVFSPARRARVNPNRADAERLATLPGIGPALADAIVQFRTLHGPFRRVSDLEGVPGIGPNRLQQMLPYLVLAEEGTWSTR